MIRTHIVTHNSRFHSDDVFAIATILLVLRKKGIPNCLVKITRSRDDKIHKTADYLVDVGAIYNPVSRRFDHHQHGGAGIRENGIPYAAFGLVWKEYGEELCGSKKVMEIIESKLVLGIDALDNGKQIFTPLEKGVNPFLIQDAISLFNPTWKENVGDIDKRFKQAVKFAKKILTRQIKKISDYLDGENIIQDIYEKTSDKRIIIMDSYYPYELFLSGKPEPLLVVRPSPYDNTWKVETIQKDYTSYSYEKRINLPENWAGKRDAELAKISTVSDAVFCHNARFLAVARSKEGALALAHLALEIALK